MEGTTVLEWTTIRAILGWLDRQQKHIVVCDWNLKLTIPFLMFNNQVLNFSIMKQARGAAKTTIKFKNLMKGNTIENTYRSGEKFETAMIEKSDHQFTYVDGVSSHLKFL